MTAPGLSSTITEAMNRLRLLLAIAPFVFCGGCASMAETPQVKFTGFSGDLLLAVDSDMPAYAYANGVLDPRSAEPDFVTIVRGGDVPAFGPRQPASNTVTTWPGAVAVSPDGRFAYVIEGRQPPDPAVSKVDSIEAGLPAGRNLSVLAIGPDTLTRTGMSETAPLATGIAVAPDGNSLAVSTESSSADLQVFAIDGGMLRPTATIDIAATVGIGNRIGKVEGVAWHPSADVLAVNLGSGGVGFVSLRRGLDGKIVGGALDSAPVPVGRLLSGVRWSADGRHVYALDTGWGPNRTDRITNGPGAVHVIAYATGAPPRVVQSVPTGLSSESFTMSQDGSLIATVNMERTYLPGGFPTGIISGRDASSASLFAVDQASGQLAPLGPPVSFPGVLPQGIAFDADGHNLAIAVFQDHAAESTAGWVQYFTISGSGSTRQLQVTSMKVPTPRGAHYLQLLPAQTRQSRAREKAADK